MNRQRMIYSADEIPLVVDIAFLCDLLKLSHNTILLRIHKGDIKATQIGKMYRIPKAEVCRLCNIPYKQEEVTI